MSDGAQMDLLTRIEASLEFMHDGGRRVDYRNLREVLKGSREALLVMRQIEEALRHGISVEPGSFLHDEVTRLCSGGPNQQREAKKLAAMSPEDRTPACDKHLSRNEEHECPWCKLDEVKEVHNRHHCELARKSVEALEKRDVEIEQLRSRLGAVEDELRHSVSVMSIVRSWLLENVRGSTHWENCEREHATCRAISQLGGVVERLSRLNLTAGVVERTVTNEETQ